jgi:hypothetical protein
MSWLGFKSGISQIKEAFLLEPVLGYTMSQHRRPQCDHQILTGCGLVCFQLGLLGGDDDSNKRGQVKLFPCLSSKKLYQL